MALTTAQKLAIEKMKDPKIKAMKKELEFMKHSCNRSIAKTIMDNSTTSIIVETN